MNNTLQKVEESQVARPLPTPADMMQQMIEKGINTENVQAFKELVVLSEHMEDRQATRDFVKDFIKLQDAVKQVKATKSVPDKFGNTKFVVSTFEEIDRQAKPVCLQNGFVYTFKVTENNANRVTVVCRLIHTSGHMEETPYTNRVGSGPVNATETQADNAAITSAKRNALCCALAIVIDHENHDPRNEGTVITPGQASELQRRVKETNSNEIAILQMAGVTVKKDEPPALEHYRRILTAKYEVIDQMLSMKERKGR
jgi:hypothetical protein